MSDGAFDIGWLKLRERVDHRSRARASLVELRKEGRARGWSRLVDLGAGSGSNMRYIAARVPWATSWTVVDHDEALLAHLEPPGRDYAVQKVVGDLASTGLDAVPGHHVVTASALLDLVSESWLTSLRDRCVEEGCAAYFALSYDGSISWDDTDPDDALVADAVNEHQGSDKGLGAALGPSAAEVAARLFAESGYRTRVQPSPWLLAGPRDFRLAERLVAGWVDAATEIRPGDGERFLAWAERRRIALREGRTRVRVGHLDVLAIPEAQGDRS